MTLDWTVSGLLQVFPSYHIYPPTAPHVAYMQPKANAPSFFMADELRQVQPNPLHRQPGRRSSGGTAGSAGNRKVAGWILGSSSLSVEVSLSETPHPHCS